MKRNKVAKIIALILISSFVLCGCGKESKAEIETMKSCFGAVDSNVDSDTSNDSNTSTANNILDESNTENQFKNPNFCLSCRQPKLAY